VVGAREAQRVRDRRPTPLRRVAQGPREVGGKLSLLVADNLAVRDSGPGAHSAPAVCGLWRVLIAGRNFVPVTAVGLKTVASLAALRVAFNPGSETCPRKVNQDEPQDSPGASQCCSWRVCPA
jgi:hypothetical protein